MQTIERQSHNYSLLIHNFKMSSVPANGYKNVDGKTCNLPVDSESTLIFG